MEEMPGSEQAMDIISPVLSMPILCFLLSWEEWLEVVYVPREGRHIPLQQANINWWICT